MPTKVSNKVASTNKKAASSSKKAAAPKKATKAATEKKNPGQAALDEKLRAEAEAKAVALAAGGDLQGRCTGKEWRVAMPEMLKAMTKAEKEGKTPLLLDTTPHHAVDTFYTYQHAQIIEGKKLVMQGRDPAGLAEVMEESRARLVFAMAKGHMLYLRMTNCAADVIGKYDDPVSLPVAVWDHTAVAEALDNDLFDLPDHALKPTVRESDCFEHGSPGMFFVHKEFRVAICSHFSPEDYEEYLTRALPLDKLQVIIVSEKDD